MTDDLTQRARDEAERRYRGPRMHVGTVTDREIAAYVAGAEWAAESLPNPADDDACCPRCGCPTRCPEGQIESLTAEVERLRKVSAAQPYETERELAVAYDELKAERDALAAEVEAYRDALREAGVEHPLGPQGVRDLGAMAVGRADDLDRLREVKASHPDPRCDAHEGDDPIACGWKLAYAEMCALLAGDDGGDEAA